MIIWENFEDNNRRENVNVAVADYISTQSRLKLYKYLSEVGSLTCIVIQAVLSSFKM